MDGWTETKLMLSQLKLKLELGKNVAPLCGDCNESVSPCGVTALNQYIHGVVTVMKQYPLCGDYIEPVTSISNVW